MGLHQFPPNLIKTQEGIRQIPIGSTPHASATCMSCIISKYLPGPKSYSYLKWSLLIRMESNQQPINRLWCTHLIFHKKVPVPFFMYRQTLNKVSLASSVKKDLRFSRIEGAILNIPSDGVELAEGFKTVLLIYNSAGNLWVSLFQNKIRQNPESSLAVTS